MKPVTLTTAAALCAIWVTSSTAQTILQVPQSIRLQHEQAISRLDHFAASKDEDVSTAARQAAAFLKKHYAKEDQFVLLPLSLLPRLAKGEFSKDMEPAIGLAERTKSMLPELENDHIKITSLLNELIAVGKRKRNEELVRLGTRVAAQSLNDIEVNAPTTILIGDYLRQQLLRAK